MPPYQFTGPGPGRPKGIPNKVTIEIRQIAKSIVDDPTYRESLLTRLSAGEAPHMETLMWHYAYGKPVDKIEVKDKTNDLADVSAEELRARSIAVAALASSLTQRVEQSDNNDESVN